MKRSGLPPKKPRKRDSVLRPKRKLSVSGRLKSKQGLKLKRQRLNDFFTRRWNVSVFSARRKNGSGKKKRSVWLLKQPRKKGSEKKKRSD